MKSVKRRDLKAILQPEPESPSVANLSALERLADRTTSTQSTTNSTQPEPRVLPVEHVEIPPSQPAPRPSEVSSKASQPAPQPPEVPSPSQAPTAASNSLEPPQAPTFGFRRFGALGGLRGETPSPAPLPPSPDVSELIMAAGGSRVPLPPQPPGSPSPSKKRPRSVQPAEPHASQSRSPSPRRSLSPERSGQRTTQSTNLTPFAKRLKVSRQTPPSQPLALPLFSTPKSQPAASPFSTPKRKSKSTSPSLRTVDISSPPPAPQAHRDPSSSPVARSAPAAASAVLQTPVRTPEEPGSSPFPEESEDEMEDGPRAEVGMRAGTGELDELEEFYSLKETWESSLSKEDGGDNNLSKVDREGEAAQSQSLGIKDPFGFQTQAFPGSSSFGDESF